ncbi:hypothetical protein GLOTRDRAFT_133906 [Gloeophyllum trabeum ATCC 11539]|uniref:Uncharacterized protein n=1 Tax=Gloeophyllum trabeum (strain ATCC 11539 / FP-39264 / Madison 617) TaxID=670483 RepID=S7RDN5_GLOTA|nr:uncharacterized protein GLOTRDRAFT_133906 [Gloeophyllum trabeum ATCC 11539]EPQ50539.1 hypothetical protein GLOTRDRAFT_133906 [Gloeophyllum trabeum ATCC 11539]
MSKTYSAAHAESGSVGGRHKRRLPPVLSESSTSSPKCPLRRCATAKTLESLRSPQPVRPNVEDESDKRLRDLGYKSEFRREMSLFGVLGISFCAVGILIGISSASLFSGGRWGCSGGRTITVWSSRGFVVLLGFLPAVYTLEGCVTAAQVAQEAKSAGFLAPTAVVFSIVGSWLVGLAYMLEHLFSVQSIASVQGTSYAIPIAQSYHDTVGKRLTPRPSLWRR